MSEDRFFPKSTDKIPPPEWKSLCEEADKMVFEKYSKILKSKLILANNGVWPVKPSGFFDSQSLEEDAKTLGITEEDLRKRAYLNNEFAGDDLPDGDTRVTRDYSRDELIHSILRDKLSEECMNETKKMALGRVHSKK
jgi:hypothetical protein